MQILKIFISLNLPMVSFKISHLDSIRKYPLPAISAVPQPHTFREGTAQWCHPTWEAQSRASSPGPYPHPWFLESPSRPLVTGQSGPWAVSPGNTLASPAVRFPGKQNEKVAPRSFVFFYFFFHKDRENALLPFHSHTSPFLTPLSSQNLTRNHQREVSDAP